MIRFLIFLLLAVSVNAAQVRFAFTNHLGVADTNSFRVVPIGSVIQSDGSFITRGRPTLLTPSTDGKVTNSFQIGHYQVTNQFIPSGFLIRVPDDSSATIYDATSPTNLGGLAMSGYNTFVTVEPTSNGVVTALGYTPLKGVAAGDNVTAVTNGGLVTISSTGGGSGVAVTSGSGVTTTTNAGVVTVADAFAKQPASANLTNWSAIVTGSKLESTNPVFYGSSPRFDVNFFPDFDSSSEIGWLQLQADGKFQRTFNGSSLSNLNASELQSGTVPDARLSSAVTMDTELVTASNSIVTLLTNRGVYYAPDYGITAAATAAANSAALQILLTNVVTAGGGTIQFPPGRFSFAERVRIPNDGAFPPTQPAIRITGAGNHHSGQSYAPNGGTILSLEVSNSFAKIDTRGIGHLEIDHVTLLCTNASGSYTPFVKTIMTTLSIHDVGFYGQNQGTNANNDGVILGGAAVSSDYLGANTNDNASFQGYQTIVQNNWFNRIRTAIKFNSHANANIFADNNIWNECGGSNAAIWLEVQGGACNGNVISGNLIESGGYTNMVQVDGATANEFRGNQFYDPIETWTQYAYVINSGGGNVIRDGFIDAGFVAKSGATVANFQTGEAGKTNVVNNYMAWRGSGGRPMFEGASAQPWFIGNDGSYWSATANDNGMTFFVNPVGGTNSNLLRLIRNTDDTLDANLGVANKTSKVISGGDLYLLSGGSTRSIWLGHNGTERHYINNGVMYSTETGRRFALRNGGIIGWSDTATASDTMVLGIGYTNGALLITRTNNGQVLASFHTNGTSTFSNVVSTGGQFIGSASGLTGVLWGVISNMPAGFADGVDDTSAGAAVPFTNSVIAYGDEYRTNYLAIGPSGTTNAGALYIHSSTNSVPLVINTVDGQAAGNLLEIYEDENLSVSIDGSGLYSGTAATVATADSTDATSFVAIFDAATGNQPVRTDGAFLYNASSGAVSATSFVGSLTGNADTATTAGTAGSASTAALISNPPWSTILYPDGGNGVEYAFRSGDGTTDFILATNGNATVNGTLTATTLAGAGGGVTLDASGFNGNLATTDNTLQEVAQKVDDLTLGVGDAFWFTNSSYAAGSAISNAFNVTATAFKGYGTYSQFQTPAGANGLLIAVDETALYVNASQFLRSDSGEDRTGIYSPTPANASMTLSNAGTITFVGALNGNGAALTLDASGFNGNLTTSDNTLQEVAQKLDDLTGGIGDVVAASNNNMTGSNNFSGALNISGPLLQQQTSNTITISWTGPSRIFVGTNANFTTAVSGTARVGNWMSQVISNGAATPITNTLGFTAFSLSQTQAVTTVQIPAFSVVQLDFYYDGATYWLTDYGPNDPNLVLWSAIAPSAKQDDLTDSASLRAALSDESGTGVAVFAGGDIGAATATTPAENDNDTSVATTAYVQTEIAGLGGGSQTNIFGSFSNGVQIASIYSSNMFQVQTTNAHVAFYVSTNGNAFFGTGVNVEGATAGSLQLREPSATGSDYVGWKAPASVTTSYQFVPPAAVASSGLLRVAATASSESAVTVVRPKSYIQLTGFDNATGALPVNTNDMTAVTFMRPNFLNGTDAASNFIEWHLIVPEDIDTGTELRAKLKFRLTGADTGTHRYVLSMQSVADSAAFTGTPGTAINLDFAGDASGASGDVESVGYTTLTGWGAAVTAGQHWVIRLARDGDTSDTSTVDSMFGSLAIEYTTNP